MRSEACKMLWLHLVTFTAASLGAAVRQPEHSGIVNSWVAQTMLHPNTSLQTLSDRRRFLEIRSMSMNKSTKKPPFIRFLHEVGHLIQEGYARLPTYAEFLLRQTLTWSLWVILSLLVWMTYYPQQPDLTEIFEEAAHVDPVDTFENSHFGCLKNPKIFFWACICPGLRWADTVGYAGLLRSQSALSIFIIAALFNGFWGMLGWFGIFTCGLMMFFRARLRDKLGLENWTCKSCCNDCCFIFCCIPCAVSQEARVARAAHHRWFTMSLKTGQRYDKSDIPDRPFPRIASGTDVNAMNQLPTPANKASSAVRQLFSDQSGSGA